ncbi:uncharacterized protein EAE98_001355 [Botrytis deweyae]|uniref:Heterokaryon incompatibility domain-containing protein n=1 Tax=Botrytis deweyae TaxID=2478750 RepID=A0ABQ7J1H2_9HELO|nr:uncharacterized protein EAE98_001355 [Botrytis deweyae]KAF7939019.1 hypothetical protein EAE98_001355 [Botrytis deweyae]
MSISSFLRSLQSHLSPSKKKRTSPSPICSRCQEFLDSCNFQQPTGLLSFKTLSKLPTPPVVENCFLCLKLLGSCLVELADQANYIKALRLSPQHVLDNSSQCMLMSHDLGRHTISKSISSGWLPTEEEGEEMSSMSRDLGVYSQKKLAGLESFVSVASFTGSDESLNLSKQWLQNCNESHVSCSSKDTTYPRFLPTRLIDIGMEESAITPRLCLRKDVPINSVYLTLSHCWGKTMPKITLLQANIEFMLREINFSQLSNAFQDALWVVRKLGGRYIWIDSLCIVQDSETDWLVESASMCDVYSNSYCNICATAARDGSERMFRNREPLQVQQGWFKTAGDEENYCVIDEDEWENEVENGMLSSRAWVCQERLLSRRNLHFGSRQLFWECLDHEASETFSRGIPQQVIEGRNVKSRVKVLVNCIDKCQSGMPFELGQIWEKIVKLYMKSNLTFKTDRLVAIGGMANAAAQHIRGKYLAGVWEKDLIYGILWNAREYPSILSKFTEAPPEKQEYTAPSWSWASFNAEIEFPRRVHRNRRDERFPQILETHLDLAIDNPFGKVCGGYIKLKGDITSATCSRAGLSCSPHYHSDFEICFGRDGKEWKNPGTTRLVCDFEDMTEIERREIYLLPVYSFTLRYRDWKARGLILFPTNRARWEFRRCGIFEYGCNDDHEDFMSECRYFSRKQRIESPEFGLQDDGKFIIKIF